MRAPDVCTPELLVAKTAGYCFGVRRAMEMAEKERPDKSLGPLIHNEQAVAKLGLGVIADPSQAGPGERVIVRAHGVGRQTLEALRSRGACVIDATCPFVQKIHEIVAAAPDRVLIVGDPTHPEVEGIVGWCRGPAEVIDEDFAFALDERHHYTLVAQTTCNRQKFQKIVEKCSHLPYNIDVCQTICNATQAHQEEIRELAKQADLTVVIGGRHSSNTVKLAEVAKTFCPATYLVETAQELRERKRSDPRFGQARRIAVTAGASTPDKIIQEVIGVMSENAFEELLNESFKEVHSGDIVKGTVDKVTDSEVTLNIGYKCDATMTREEYSLDSTVVLTDEVKVGDEMEAKIIHVGDMEITVSRRRLMQAQVSGEIREAVANKAVLTGKVTEANENGVVVIYKGNRVFIPARLLDVRRTEDPTVFLGQEISFRILPEEQKRRGKGLTGDRRSLMFEQRSTQRAAVLEGLSEGARLTGTVKNLTSYCAFIDLGGIDGMLHISEMSYSPVKNPAQLYKEGDTVNVIVKSYDPETQRISLTAKLPENDPWIGADEKYAVGTVVTGKVVRFAEFGAFIQLEEGIDGLVHISHISSSFVKKAADALKIGQEVEARVIDFNPEKRRISLSIRDLEEPAAPAEEAPEEAAEEAPAEETLTATVEESVE